MRAQPGIIGSQAVLDKGWFTILRLYETLEPWFDKTFKLPALELVK